MQNDIAKVSALSFLVSEGPATGDRSMPSSDFRQTLKPAEKDRIGNLLTALEPFRNLRGTMPMQYVIAFLLVALDEGQGTTEYARRAGVSASVMSRHLLDIGDRNRHMEEGFGLVTQRQDPLNLSKHQHMLTDKGRAIAQQILRALSKG
jgi:DNA-binding MarR family transcriptional regulator